MKANQLYFFDEILIIDFLHKGRVIDVIYLGFNKLCDTVPYGKFLVEMKKIAIDVTNIKWVRNQPKMARDDSVLC